MTSGSRPRSRGSMLAAAQPEEKPAMRAADGTVDYFKLRVAAQQFMNENAPLFAALAKANKEAGAALGDGTLARAIEASTQLATATARRFSGKASPLPHEIRPFRHAAAEVVAARWREDGLDGFDPDAVAEQHAAAFALVDEGLDKSVYAETPFSDEASLAMTAAAVALAVMRPVMTYDFRRDRGELVQALAGEVLAVAAEAAAGMLPPDARPDERRSVLQTTANRLSEVMAAVYDRKARQAVAHLADLSEPEREAFLRKFDAEGEIRDGFRGWATVFAATTLAFARSAAGAVAAHREQSKPMQP